MPSYVIENGQKKLVHRTEEHPAGSRARDGAGRALDGSEPSRKPAPAPKGKGV